MGQGITANISDLSFIKFETKAAGDATIHPATTPAVAASVPCTPTPFRPPGSLLDFAFVGVQKKLNI